MIEENLIAGLNWAIENDRPLHEVLKGLCGKKIRVELPIGARLDWEIEADGLLKDIDLSSGASAQQNADSLSKAKPHITVFLDWVDGMRIEGSASTAEQLGPLLTLAKSRLLPWQTFLKDSPAGLMAKQTADYALHEAGLAVHKDLMENHKASLRSLRDSLERLEKRLDQLERTRSL